MKAQFLLAGLLFTGIVSCRSQEATQHKDTSKKGIPKEEVVVTKKYDENGNLIALDSVYTYYYSNMEGDTLATDSILSDFNIFFGDNFSGFSNDDLFNMDSTYMSGFFHDDFFEQSFVNQDKHLLKMMQEMDSLKNEFFKGHTMNADE
jgi:hypothetical protein